MPKLLLRTRWPFIIFAVAVLLAAQIMVTLNYFYQNSVQDIETIVANTEDSLARQHVFSQKLQNIFLAQRSYTVTGQPFFKDKYRQQMPELLASIQPLVDNARLRDPTDAAAISAELRIMVDFMNQGIAQRDALGSRLTSSPARAREAYLHMSRLEKTLTHYMQRERLYLKQLKDKQRARQVTYNRTILLAALLSAVFLGALGYLLLKQQQKENRTQADLKSTKERLDLAITGANDGIWDWDLANDRIFFSARLKDIAGYRDAEMPNDMKAYDLLLHGDDRAQLWQHHDDYLNKRTDVYETTFRIKHKDGTWRWIMSRGQALWNSDGEAIRMVGVHTDITSMKMMEEKLNTARETAERANAAKSDFLSNISHEIRTPLNAIIGISRILAKATPLTEAYREHVNVMHTGANNLYSLINDLLDLSKLEQGSLTLETREFRLRDLIQENVELYRYHAREKSIALTFDSNIPSDDIYIGDSLRLGQIVNNLLSNAIKFTETGTVHVGLTCLGAIQDTRKGAIEGAPPKYYHIQLLVEDTGIGIPADQLDNIFNKFAQSDRSISRRYGGTGLGLSICKELATLMGATITVHSMEGQGSEFRVDLHLERAKSTTAALTGKSGDRILIVEDYQANIYVLEALLESIGYPCDSVMTGDDALRVLLSDRRNLYAAILMDLELPDMTGYQVAEKNRLYESKYALPSIPIIATTAHATQAHRDQCFASGMNDYLMKPVDLSALEKTLALYVPDHDAKSMLNNVA